MIFVFTQICGNNYIYILYVYITNTNVCDINNNELSTLRIYVGKCTQNL